MRRIFEHHFSCDPSDFVHFRERIGKAGVEKAFAYSVSFNGKDACEKQILSNTTVQENNTTFPIRLRRTKLAKKKIDHCNKIAKEEGVDQRQAYVRTSKQLIRDSYHPKHPKTKNKSGAEP